MLSSVMLNLEVGANNTGSNSSAMDNSLNYSKKIGSSSCQSDYSNGRRWSNGKKQNLRYNNSSETKAFQAQKKGEELNGHPGSSFGRMHPGSCRQSFEILSIPNASNGKCVPQPTSTNSIEGGDTKNEEINIAAASLTNIRNYPNSQKQTSITYTSVENATRSAPMSLVDEPQLKTSLNESNNDSLVMTNSNKTPMSYQLHKSNEEMCSNGHTDTHRTMSNEKEPLTNVANATMDVTKALSYVTNTSAIHRTNSGEKNSETNVLTNKHVIVNGPLDLLSKEPVDNKIVAISPSSRNFSSSSATTQVRIPSETGDVSMIYPRPSSNKNNAKTNEAMLMDKHINGEKKKIEETSVKDCNDQISLSLNGKTANKNENVIFGEVKTKEDKLNKIEGELKVGVCVTPGTTIRSTIGGDVVSNTNPNILNQQMNMNMNMNVNSNVNNNFAEMIQALQRSASMLNNLSMPDPTVMTIPALSGNGLVTMDSSAIIASNPFDGNAIGNNMLFIPPLNGLDTSHWNNFDPNACFTDKSGLKTWNMANVNANANANANTNTNTNTISNSCYFPSTFYPMWTDIGMVSGPKNTFSMSATAFSKPSNVNDKSENESIVAKEQTNNSNNQDNSNNSVHYQHQCGNGLDFNASVSDVISAFAPSLMLPNYGTPIEHVYSNLTPTSCNMIQSYPGSTSFLTAFPDTWKYPMNTTILNNDGMNGNTSWGMEYTDDYSLSSYGNYNSQMSSSSHAFIPFNPQSYSLENSSLQSFGSLTQTSTTTANGGTEGGQPESESTTLQTNRTEEMHENIAIGDQVLYGNQNATVLSFDWDHNPPQAQVHIHSNNYSIKIPISHLKSVQQNQFFVNQSSSKDPDPVSSNHYRTNNEENKEHQKQRKNHFQRLSEETMMKLPHLRKHKEYIKTIEIGNGPRDYNAFRETLNVGDDKQVQGNDMNDISNGSVAKDSDSANANASASANWDQNQNQKTTTNKTSAEKMSEENNNNNNEGRRHNKKKGYCQEKSDLYKTELCENWVSKGHCTYGRKCHFAHGFEDMRFRVRVANYKTQPCCDPARSDSRLCLFGKRCNYAHPGEPLRCTMTDEYLDEEYFDKLGSEFTEQFPFGIYM